MDIPALSMAMADYQMSASASIAVMSKVLDTVEATGEALTEMMAASVPGLGENIDIRA